MLQAVPYATSPKPTQRAPRRQEWLPHSGMQQPYWRGGAQNPLCWGFFCLRGKRDLPLLASLGILTDLGAVGGLTTTASGALTAALSSFFFFLSAIDILPKPRADRTRGVRCRRALLARGRTAAIMRQRFDSSRLGQQWPAESADGGSSESVLSGWPERPVPTGYHRYARRIHPQHRSSLSAQKSAHPAYFANSSTTR